MSKPETKKSLKEEFEEKLNNLLKEYNVVLYTESEYETTENLNICAFSGGVFDFEIKQRITFGN